MILLSRWLAATSTFLQNEYVFAVFAGQFFKSQSEKERPRPLYGIFFMACFLFESYLYAYWFLHSNTVCNFWFLFGFNSWARLFSCLCSFRRFFRSYKFRFVTYVQFLWPFSKPPPVLVFPKQVCFEMSSFAFLIQKNFNITHLPRLGYQFVPGWFCISSAWNALRVSLSSL